MKVHINKIFSELNDVRDQYKYKNLVRAERLLSLTGFQKYLGAVFSGFAESLRVATLFGTVVATILSAAAFISLTISPIGWAIIGTGFVYVVIAAGISQYKKYLSNLPKLDEQQIDLEKKKSQISELVRQNCEVEEKIEQLQSELRRLGIAIPITQIEGNSDATDDDYTATQFVNCSRNNEHLSQHHNTTMLRFLHKVTQLFKSILLAPFSYIAAKLRLPQLVDYLKQKFPVIASIMRKIIDTAAPFRAKILEFLGIYAVVVAAISGVLSGIAGILGINIANMSFWAAFSSIMSVAGLSITLPVAFGVILALGAVITLALIASKVLYDDPIAILTCEFKNEGANLPRIIDDNIQSLELAKSRLEALQLRKEIALKERQSLQELESARREGMMAEFSSVLTAYKSCFDASKPTIKDVAAARRDDMDSSVVSLSSSVPGSLLIGGSFHSDDDLSRSPSFSDTSPAL